MKKSVSAAIVLIFFVSVVVIAAASYQVDIANKEINQVAADQLTRQSENNVKNEKPKNTVKSAEEKSTAEKKSGDKKEKVLSKPAEQKKVVKEPDKQKADVNYKRATTTTVNRGTSRLSDEVYWLARIIHAEAEAEPFVGKVAVGNVILNRVNSSKFPNTIYGVIFDKQYGRTQFSPVIDGRIYNTPGDESIKAAKAALKGYRPVGSALYFLNPKKSQNFWIVKNRKYMTTIGKHDFYY
ncbi:N-acetylmuramoyl-L-alanine amidase [Desulfohalotomaculum tongense]|uniref:cell wall hydrolase n=1 Tax=Desulforadius tongensis TaxID=1216062 RepID=UPI00195812B2|nr:cell wall hydrolase [Desulforadius tongensis]MBM7853970.1 N-acetylmuramoyl-L-alanine amidase [Desulforadius tongensis]